MMVLFFHAARLAMVALDPYMSSRPLAEALLKAPPGELIVDDQYYTFSSVFFYTNRRALLLNGRVNNLEYGSYAPDAPKGVFIDDRECQRRWREARRYYLVADGTGQCRASKAWSARTPCMWWPRAAANSSSPIIEKLSRPIFNDLRE